MLLGGGLSRNTLMLSTHKLTNTNAFMYESVKHHSYQIAHC